MIRVGIIGCGSITKFRHAPEYKANPDCELAGFFDTRIERAEEMAGLFGGKAYLTVRELLEDQKIDAVSVCTANSSHKVLTVEALNNGKHVLCEKPMATTVTECLQMIEAAKVSRKTLMIGHSQRFMPAHLKVKEILKSGSVGRLLSFRTTWGHRGPEAWSADKGKNTWFFRKNDSAMGAMGDIGIHKVDLLRWLMDDEIEEVQAILATVDKRDENNDLIAVDDNAVCLLKSRSGIIGTLSASWTYYGGDDNSTVLYCTNGTIKIYDDLDYPVVVTRRNGDNEYYEVGKVEGSSGIIDSFLYGINNGQPPEISGEEGLVALKVVLACMEASEKGTRIRI